MEETASEMQRLKNQNAAKIAKLASTEFYAGKAIKKYVFDERGSISNPPNSRFIMGPQIGLV